MSDSFETPLPDTSKWQPKKSSAETLQSAFRKRCIGIEKLIHLKSQLEKEMNINNFDSGLGVEDIIREELTQILPQRYSIKSGVINDRFGNTGGDFDIIIFNEHWFPLVKAGATAASRRIHLPIEGVYAVCEIKQTLDVNTLDAAMEKLVICHRLHRPNTYANRIVENLEQDECIHGLKNPLYSSIIALDLKDNIDLDRIVERFFDINKTLSRLEVVRNLCILRHGSVTWGYRNDNEEINLAYFMKEDLFHPIVPVYHKVPDIKSPFFIFLLDLLHHLYHSVLAPEDIAAWYGYDDTSLANIKVPKSSSISLQPDDFWMSRLQEKCVEDQELMQSLDVSNFSKKMKNSSKAKKAKGFG